MTTDRSLLDEINRSIGTLTERVDGMRVDVAESRAETSGTRRLVFERLEASEKRAQGIEQAMLDRLSVLETASAALVTRVTKMEPTFDAFNRLRQRGVGALTVVGFAATVIGGAIALKWDQIVAAMSRFFGPGP